MSKIHGTGATAVEALRDVTVAFPAGEFTANGPQNRRAGSSASPSPERW